MRSYRTITDRGQTFASVCENKTLDVIMPSYFWRVTADKALLIPQILPNTFRNYTVRFNFMRYKSDYYHTRCVELYFRRVMWGHIALLRLNDNFIIQSIPLGDDSLNRAWWFIMGVITQSFSPKSTTWLPTQHTERHVRVQTPKDKKGGTRYCHSEGKKRTQEPETNEQAWHVHGDEAAANVEEVAARTEKAGT